MCLRVQEGSVAQFLESHHFSKEVLLIARGGNIVNVLWKEEERWHIADIFGKKLVPKYVASGLILKLTAANCFELVNRQAVSLERLDTLGVQQTSVAALHGTN